MQTLEDKEEAQDAASAGPPVFAAGYRPPQHESKVTPDLLGKITSGLIVALSTIFVIWQLHPMTLLFTNAMDVGGDNAAHVAAPYYLIHYLLPHFQLSGWDPDWFDGFPLYVFYFPLPALLVALLNVAMPYAVAFKLVTVAGTVLMPIAAYLFGRLASFRRPVPALMAAAMLPFLFNTSYTIDGGNIASTMAGEFSFSLSMAFGLVFLGVVAKGLDTGKYRGWAAVLFAACLLCHVVPGLFFAFAALLFLIAKGDWRRIYYLAPAGIAGALLAGFFLVPFGAYLRYTSSMGYSRVDGFFKELFPPGYLWADYWVAGLAVVGLMFAVHMRFFADKRRDTYALAVGGMIIFAGLAFSFLPSGQVYNARWIPFWFMSIALMAAYGAGELIRLLGKLLEFDRWSDAVGAVLAGASAIALVAVPLNGLAFLGLKSTQSNFVPDWVSWNYTGYQGKPGWNQYRGIVQMLQSQARIHGCGRVEYEYTGTQSLTDAFGSSMAFMSLPMWTNGCIDTTEGLYFESSTTTPFHFLDSTELSSSPSQPVVGIPYGSYDVADGIKHDQLMGVKYFLAGTAETETYASRDSGLQYLASAPGSGTYGTVGGKKIKNPNVWKLYLIKDSTLVTPLSYLPEVESGMSGQQWLNLGIQWYQNEQYWSVPVALDGPGWWPRATRGTLIRPQHGIPIRPTTVSNVVSANQSISFDVSRTGQPVEVKVPYFPNWHASGAEGPWEISPNLMVVVPTSRHVVITYGLSRADIAGFAASGLGVGLLVTFAVMGPINFEKNRRRAKHSRKHAAGSRPKPPAPPELDAATNVTESIPAIGFVTEQIPVFAPIAESNGKTADDPSDDKDHKDDEQDEVDREDAVEQSGKEDKSAKTDETDSDTRDPRDTEQPANEHRLKADPQRLLDRLTPLTAEDAPPGAKVPEASKESAKPAGTDDGDRGKGTGQIRKDGRDPGEDKPKPGDPEQGDPN